MTGLERGGVLVRRDSGRGSGAGVAGACAAAREHEKPATITTTNKEIVPFIRIAYFKTLANADGDYQYYQLPLADSSKGDELCARTRCDPKLTLGSEIVRELPRPSSRETFSD